MKAEIDAAIAAHGYWKVRLKEAIRTGTSEFKPTLVRMDSQCEFGKWLYQSISPGDKNSPNYATVKELHAKFHKEAGRILELAISKKNVEAEQGIALGSEFARLSAEMVRTLSAWKNASS